MAMNRHERACMTRDLQRALAILTDVRKRASLAGEHRITKRLVEGGAHVAETITTLHGELPKLQIADMVDA